jgi:hypothetical protein
MIDEGSADTNSRAFVLDFASFPPVTKTFISNGSLELLVIFPPVF